MTDEFDLIEKIRRRLGDEPPEGRVVVGAGDDAAVVRALPGRDVVVTCDTLIEGRHFDLRLMSAEDIGYRAMAVNVSDIVAMGGEPTWAVIALELREGVEAPVVLAMYEGVLEAAREYGFAVIGGNVVGGVTRLGVAVTMGGDVGAGCAWRRSGARVGDDVYVTGTLGGAALGFAALRVGIHGAVADAWAARYRRPVARLREARLLTSSGCITSCVDVSDGLAQDLGHVARESGVGVRIRADQLPLTSGYRDGAARFFDHPWHAALWAGDDYELAFTANALPPEGTRIGDVVAGTGVHVVDADGHEIAPIGSPGFNHGVRAR